MRHVSQIFFTTSSIHMSVIDSMWTLTKVWRHIQISSYSFWLSVNSLAPGRFQANFRKITFQLILVIDDWSISCKIVFKWMPMDLAGVKSTLVQVMAWCRQATSHYLSQCWPRSLSPYGVTRPQWVNPLRLGKMAPTLADNIFKCISMNEKFWI